MRNSDPVIVAVAGDAGGASALAPVIQHLRAAGRGVAALAYRQAPAVWAEQGLAFEPVAEGTDEAAAGRRLRAARAGLLLAGTSVNGCDLERRFVAAARRCGLPSLAVLDFWSNYRERFADAKGDLADLPDRIAVMDEFARQEMIAEGFEPGRLAVTGQPAFDKLEEFGCPSPRRRAALRGELGLGERDRLVFFASQPLADLYGHDASNPLFPGYTEHTVLRALLDALQGIAGRHPERLALVVRPHPRERPGNLRVPADGPLRVRVEANGNRWAAALAADLVVGMTTVMLVEACLLGCVVLSLQPGLRIPDPLPTTRFGASAAVYTEGEIEAAVERLLFDPEARAAAVGRTARLGFEPGATARVIGLIDAMLPAPLPTQQGLP